MEIKVSNPLSFPTCLSVIFLVCFGYGVDHSGTALERLWMFVQEFQSKKTRRGDELSKVNSRFKSKLWKYLLRHDGMILKAGDQLLLSASGNTVDSDHERVCFSAAVSLR